MGVCANLSLPPNVRINNVADVIGRLMGCPATLLPFSDGCDGRYVEVNGVRTEPAVTPECAWIIIKGDAVSSRLLYHFEGPSGRRLISAGPDWAHTFAAVADFFGGKVDFFDCDDVEVDHEVPDKPDELNCPSDGEPWDDLQRRIAAVVPLHERAAT